MLSFAQGMPGTQKRYAEKDIVDSAQGIHLYARLMEALGGDSVTHNSAGNSLQGWHDEFYTSGQLMHRGFYVNGKVITFKNFYENGRCERSVENPDPLHCNVTIFFNDGQPRRQVQYYNGKAQKLYEFYESGLPKYAEENEKEMKYLTLKKSWYINGNLESSLELTDRKTKRYTQKSYYLNGQLKEEGTIELLTGTSDYVKDGNWYSYDSNGKKRGPEKHLHGIKVNSN